MTKPVLQVAVGIVLDDSGKVLVGQRVKPDAYFQKWEFPGGKLEQGESVVDALKREFLEEVGIDISESREFMVWEHSYPDRDVKLFVRIIDAFIGKATSREGQALKWVSLEEIAEMDFLAGNQVIIERLIEHFKT
ncbi:MAG: 8-oxo-dGTP diphosphatase MutT [Arenicella sp.]|jgi:8-oxo-dGTP diphosphatase|nr:8-oxo-dGTP diphosphatase MutT [Arenicella sp.]HAU68578.1 8-oxo-dGTP diphosphatase MutT [Gammaproteobacteria bacterium]